MVDCTIINMSCVVPAHRKDLQGKPYQILKSLALM